MNRQRRAEIAAIVREVESLTMMVDQLRERIEAVRDEEQDGFDNLPESFQNGERGERMQSAIVELDNAIGELESIDLDGVTGSLEAAAE